MIQVITNWMQHNQELATLLMCIYLGMVLNLIKEIIYTIFG